MRDNNSNELVNHSQTSKFSTTSISDGLQKVSSFLINKSKDTIVSFSMNLHSHFIFSHYYYFHN